MKRAISVAEDHIDRGLDRFADAAPYLGIVERKYTQGWFRSEQEVTFEVLGGAGRPLGATGRFTVHNEILHGPVLGFSGFGLARVNSTIALSDEQRAELVKAFGTDAPFKISTRVGFLGGGTTTLSSEARKLEPRPGAEISWDDLELSLSYSADFDSISIEGDWPRFEAHDPAQNLDFVLDDLELDGKSTRVKGPLYATDLEFSIDELSYVAAGQPKASVKKLQYLVDTTNDGDFLSVATRFGAGAIVGGQLSAMGFDLTGLHFDLTLRRLHTNTLSRISEDISSAYKNPTGASMLPDHLLELCRHDPELLLDRVGFETKDGSAILKGVIRLKGVTAQDLRMGALSLLARIEADLHFEAQQKVIEKIEGGRGAMMGAVDGGYAELTGDRVVSRLEFKGGELKINGKVSGIPGLGTPPAGPE
jgi:uncharacterized protein YdgA (DUF945 family)